MKTYYVLLCTCNAIVNVLEVLNYRVEKTEMATFLNGAS